MTMAIPIKAIPTLEGKDAEIFLQIAEAAEQNTKKRNISRDIHLVKEFLSKQKV